MIHPIQIFLFLIVGTMVNSPVSSPELPVVYTGDSEEKRVEEEAVMLEILPPPVSSTTTIFEPKVTETTLLPSVTPTNTEVFTPLCPARKPEEIGKPREPCYCDASIDPGNVEANNCDPSK